MIVRGDISALLLAGLKTQFFNTFTEGESEYEKICTIIPSDKDTEHYAWLGSLPSVNEFLDERQIGEFSEYEYAIKNRKWESTVAIDRTALEDDQYGQISLRMKSLATEARQHLDQLTFGLVANGFTADCYDGTPMYGSHPIGKNSNVSGQTQSNLMTSGGGASALNQATVQQAMTAMRRTLNDQGRPMGVVPDTLLVAPENEFQAWQIVNSLLHVDPVPIANYSQNLAANPLRGLLKVVTSPYLPSATAWFLLDTKRPVRSIFLQMRREFEFNALENTSEQGFMRDQYLYGIRGRYNVGYGDWRSIYASPGT